MIFKIMPSGGNKFHAVDYNEKKQRNGSAKLMYFRGFGLMQNQEVISKEMFQNYLAAVSSLNSRIKNPSFHASLSCRGKEMTHEQLKDYALDIMEHLGYKEQPILIYAHNDTENNHIHIVTTRVDVNGKKIPHNFEKKKANSYVNAIMNRNPKLEFEAIKNINKNYKFTTVAQFNLLMEARGYKVEKNNSQFNYYKYGSKQGPISLADVQAMLVSSDAMNSNRKKQIRAIIMNNKNIYSPELLPPKITNFKGQNIKENNLNSELTTMLKNKYGLEFMFFTSKEHEKPYGYAIIDHTGKNVFKGGEIMKLENLLKETDLKVVDYQNISNSITNIDENTFNNYNSNEIFDQFEKSNEGNIDTEIAKTINDIIDSSNLSRKSNADIIDDYFKKKKYKRKRY